MSEHLRLEASGYRLRAYDTPPATGERPPYRGVATITLHGDTAVIALALGRVHRRDVDELYAELRARGVRWLLAERAPGRVMPRAEQIGPDQPFAGWWRSDLHEGVADGA